MLADELFPHPLRVIEVPAYSAAEGVTIAGMSHEYTDPFEEEP